VKAALSRARITLDLPPIEVGTASGGGEEAEERTTNERAEEKQVRQRREPASYGVTLKDLLDAGLVEPGLELRKKYLGTEVTATVEAGGRVRVGSEVFDSLSIAAGAARVAVKGPPPDGRRYYQTNGWTFWEYRDGDGHRHEIQAIRELYLAQRS
jgi:hypothetical protein